MPGSGTIQIKGTTYVVPKATDNDLLTVRNHVRKAIPKEAGPFEKVQRILESPGWKSLSAETRRELELKMASEAAEQELGKKKPTPEEKAAREQEELEQVGELLLQPKYCAFFAWILLKKTKPSLSLADLEAVIDDSNAADVLNDLLEESGTKKLAAEAKAGAAGSSPGTSSTALPSTKN